MKQFLKNITRVRSKCSNFKIKVAAEMRRSKRIGHYAMR